MCLEKCLIPKRSFYSVRQNVRNRFLLFKKKKKKKKKKN